MVVEPANFLHQLSPQVEEIPLAPVVDEGPGEVVHVDQFCQEKVSDVPKLDSETGMIQFTEKKKIDAEPNGKLQFCLPTMDEMACFQECETNLHDDEFIDLEDGPQLAQHWLENCKMIEKEKDVSKDWSDDS